jgi:hypothetical protein
MLGNDKKKLDFSLSGHINVLKPAAGADKVVAE